MKPRPVHGWNRRRDEYACDWGSTSAATTSHWIAWNNLYQQRLYRSVTEDDSAIWVAWNAKTNCLINETHRKIVRARRMPETAQQRAHREQAEREIAAQQERTRLATLETQREREAAKDKAYKLLNSALDDKQKEELKTKGFFHCKSKRGHTYRIYRGSHGNVKRLDERGREIESLCVQPAYVPEGDCMLAQKLHIENDEEGFRQTANIRPTIH